MRPFSSFWPLVLLSSSACALLPLAQSPISLPPSLPLLSDILTVNKRASLFYDFARDSDRVIDRLGDPLQRTTVLVPVNQAIIALPTKPHLPPAQSSINLDKLSVQDQHQVYQDQIERWVNAHLLPEMIELPLSSVSSKHATLLDDFSIEFKSSQQSPHSVIVLPGQANVLDVVQASNGQVVFLDGVLSVPPS